MPMQFFEKEKPLHTLFLLLPQKTFMFHFYISLISFFQIKTFWAQLSWPDVESSYAYISKILDVSLFLHIFSISIWICLALHLYYSSHTFCFIFYYCCTFYLVPLLFHLSINSSDGFFVPH